MSQGCYANSAGQINCCLKNKSEPEIHLDVNTFSDCKKLCLDKYTCVAAEYRNDYNVCSILETIDYSYDKLVEIKNGEDPVCKIFTK